MSFGSKLLARRRAAAWLPDITAGALCAVVTVAYAGSFASLVFGGRLEVFSGQGLLAALLSSVVAMVVLSWRSSFPISLGGPDSNPSAILAVTLAGFTPVLAPPGEVPDAAWGPTVLVYVFGSSVGCGLLLYLLGERGWGRYVRYIPHPVIGGFLAGTGWLLVAGAAKMLTGHALDLGVGQRLHALHPIAWAVPVGMAVVLTLATRLVRHFFIIPGVFLLAMGVFYLALKLCGVSIHQAREWGLLLQPLRLDAWSHVATFPFADVRWDLVLLHGKDFLAMTMVVIITILLNATSLDLALGRDADFDAELKAVGLANVVSGLLGGMVAVNSFNRTMLSRQAGGHSRWAARVCAAIVLLVVLSWPEGAGWMPRPVLTGLILYLGVSLLLTWLWDARRMMTRGDRLMVVAILVIVAGFGVVSGVILGVVLACLSFVFAFSRAPAIRYAFTLAGQRSNVERSRRDEAHLRQQAEAVRGFVLQGYLFFGTASRLLDAIRTLPGRWRFLVLDMRSLQGLDASSVLVLRRIRERCAAAGAVLVVTGVGPVAEARLRAGGFTWDAGDVVRLPDLDHGLEWCENRLIAEETAEALSGALGTALEPGEVAEVAAFFGRRSLAAGETLVRQGEPGDPMFWVESGQLSIYLRAVGDTGAASGSRRLRTYGPGTVVGEMGLYTGGPRSADVVADVETVVFTLSRAGMVEIERRHPTVAHKLHRHVIGVMAQRLRNANEALRTTH